MKTQRTLLLIVACMIVAFAPNCLEAQHDVDVATAAFRQAWVASSTDEAEPAAVGIITKEELPAARPPATGPQGYKFCGFECARSYKVLSGNDTAGMAYVEVRFKPIRGVNSTMMRWLFENLAGSVTNPVDGKQWPMYLLFHPRDHVFHLSEPARLGAKLGVGSNLTWCEMMLTNCVYQPANKTSPWVCPPKAQGYIKSTPAAEYRSKLQTKESMQVSRFTNRGIQFSRYIDVGSGPQIVATVLQSWSDAANGTSLTLTTKFWLGLMANGSATVFDTSSFGQLVSKSIMPNTILGGVTNIKDKDLQQYGLMNVLHFLEEYGSLKNWLPQVYAARSRE